MGVGDIVEVGEGRRRYWTPQEKRQIVEQTLSSGLSVAIGGSGAWCKREPGLLLEEALPGWAVGERGGAEQQVRLLPVSVSDEQPAETEPEEATSLRRE